MTNEKPITSITISGDPFIPNYQAEEIREAALNLRVNIRWGYMNCFECPVGGVPRTCGLIHGDCILGHGTKWPKGMEAPEEVSRE